MNVKRNPVAVEVVGRDEGTSFLTNSASNYQTHKLFRLGQERMELRPTKAELAMTLQFPFHGLFLLIASFLFNAPAAARIVMIIIGLGLLVVGGYLSRLSIRAKVFDKEEGLFKKRSLQVALNDIAALQVLRGESRRGYSSYELNLVMPDGMRVNVIETGGSGKVMMEYAKALSEFLGKPLSLPGMQGY